MFALDENCLIRIWDLKTNKCIKSYPIEVASQEKEINGSQTTFQSKMKITCARVSKDFKNLFVAFENGIVQINNLYSGSILYNKSLENQVVLDNEVASFGLFSS